MKTNIRKFPAVLLLAVLCLTVFPISAMAAGVAEVKIPVSVELSGEKPSPDENILTVTGAGKAEFPAVSYSVPGVYCYTVSQQPGSLKKGHYDSTVYYVKVTVTNGDSGELEAVVAAHTDAQMVSEKQDITFVNTYDPADTPTPTPSPAYTPTSTPATPVTTTPDKTGSNPTASGTSSSHVKSMPKTGDNTNIGKWIAVICVSGCAVLLIIGFARKKQKTDKK